MKILPTSEVKLHMGQVVKDVVDDESSIIITRHGKAEAVILPFEVFQEMQKRLEDLDDLYAMAEAEKEYKKGQYKTLDELKKAL